MTVTLKGRTFYKDGDWNTVCLPFDLNGSVFLASPLSSAVSIMELDVDGYYDAEGKHYDEAGEGRHQTGFDATTSTLYLNFTDVAFDDDPTDENNLGEGMKAGVPYLVKWPTGSNITNPVFTGVTINAATPASVVASKTGLNTVRFVGTYAPVSYSDMNKSVLFLGTKNKLYYPDGTTTNTIKAFRAYFQVDLGEASGVKSLVMNFCEDDDATGIQNIKDLKDSKAIYNLAGQRLNKMQKGINIINGKKVLK